MSLDTLNTKKIFVDLKYWKDEITLKREMLEEMEKLFGKAISQFLNDNKDLKQEWDSFNKKKEEQMEQIIIKESSKKDTDVSNDESNNNIEEEIEIDTLEEESKEEKK